MNKTYFDSVNKIWGSKVPTIYNSNVSVGYLLLNVLQNTLDSITQTIKIASYLERMDCRPNDIVGFLASNSDNFAPTVFACLTLGLPINCLSPVLPDCEIILFYSNTKPKLIFCDAIIIEKVKSVVKELPIASQIFTIDKKVDGFEFIGDIVDDDYETAQTFIMPLIDSDTVAFILATSGTSSHPKQVCKSHKEIIEENSVQSKSKLSSKEIWFGFTGIDWISGIIALTLGTFYCGKRIITTRKFDPNLMLEVIGTYNVTTTITTPRLLASFDDIKCNPLTSMRVLLLGGVAVSRDVCARAKVLFPNSEICPSYGCSEAGIVALNVTYSKLDSVGQLYGNVEVKILNDVGDPLGVGETGEIVYKKSVVFRGYFNDLVRTNEITKEGWVYSGDLGYFDNDGYLFITDRETDVIKNQIYISPIELESIISEISGVSEVCVVGAVQEGLGGDLMFAFVIKKPDSDINEKFVEDYVSARVIDVKKISGGVHLVDSFPMSTSGKVRRFEIRKWAQEKCNNSKF